MEQDIETLIQDKIAFHKAEVKRYEEALSVLRGGGSLVAKTPTAPHGDGAESRTESVRIVLSDGYPRTARMLMEAYNARRNSASTLSSFSAFITELLKAGVVKKHLIESNPMPTRNWYGLAEWFDGPKIKEEYRRKIK